MLKEGSVEATLLLEDFFTRKRISSRPTTCPSKNAGLVAVLKNLQTLMQIVFSDANEKCLDGFIEKLEGARRPMELVPSDFLKYLVELTLRRIFRVIKSVKSSAIPELDVQGPEPCSKRFGQSFD